MPRSYYGKVAVDLANKPPPYIPIFLTLFKLYGGFLILNSRNTKTKNNKKKSKLFSTQCNYLHCKVNKQHFVFVLKTGSADIGNRLIFQRYKYRCYLF
jgi:hypothetical protein